MSLTEKYPAFTSLLNRKSAINQKELKTLFLEIDFLLLSKELGIKVKQLSSIYRESIDYLKKKKSENNIQIQEIQYREENSLGNLFLIFDIKNQKEVNMICDFLDNIKKTRTSGVYIEIDELEKIWQLSMLNQKLQTIEINTTVKKSTLKI